MDVEESREGSVLPEEVSFTDRVLRSKIIEKKRSGFEMTILISVRERCLSWVVLYEVLKV